MGATSQQLFRMVILPASPPTIFVGIRPAGASAMLVLVASGMIGTKAGFGYLGLLGPMTTSRMWFTLGKDVIGVELA